MKTGSQNEILVRLRPPSTSPVYDTYWYFATERQAVFHRRVRGEPAPWTSDPVICAHRFTNAYRAADRVSQYLIQNVAYQGIQEPTELLFRVVLFKLFNRIETWELLGQSLGPLTANSFNVDRYDEVLSAALSRGERIYSAAYIMPPASRDLTRKHRTHLDLVEQMLQDRLAHRLADAPSMGAAFEMIRQYRGIGPFLAYQLTTDLNYTSLINFPEMDFVAPGPGALSGLRKCFSDPGDYDNQDLIRYTAARQAEEFEGRGLGFQDLWGRPLQLVDCQNLFCEVDKYARVVHPHVLGSGTRSRIKQRFRPHKLPISLWFPPKWGINHRLPASVSANAHDGSLFAIHQDNPSTPNTETCR